MKFYILFYVTDDLQGDTYLDIGCPPSPSITTVATYRDNILINLPWNLLVEGDIIMLGPSEIAPTHILQVMFNFHNSIFCLLKVKVSPIYGLYVQLSERTLVLGYWICEVGWPVPFLTAFISPVFSPGPYSLLGGQ